MATGYRKYNFEFTDHMDNLCDDHDMFAFLLGINRGGYQHAYI